jgi:hypothetical protein
LRNLMGRPRFRLLSVPGEICAASENPSGPKMRTGAPASHREVTELARRASPA